MAPLHINVIRNIFAAGEHIAPRLAGRAAFELFCRTPNPARLTPGERKAVSRAKTFMEGARHHRLATPAGCVALHEFRPPEQGGEKRQTVLVVHGWRSRTEYMRALIAAHRAAGYRVVSLDLPGHGGSSGRRLNMASAVGAVRAAADWFGPFAAIVGHSFGGAVAINAAVGSVEGFDAVPTERIVAIASPSSLPNLFRQFGKRLHLGPRSQEIVNRQVLRVTGRPLPEFETADQLRRLPIPTFLIHDEDDAEVPVDEAILAAGAGGHVRLHLTRGLGHRRIINDAATVQATVAFVTENSAEPVLH